MVLSGYVAIQNGIMHLCEQKAIDISNDLIQREIAAKQQEFERARVEFETQLRKEHTSALLAAHHAVEKTRLEQDATSTALKFEIQHLKNELEHTKQARVVDADARMNQELLALRNENAQLLLQMQTLQQKQDMKATNLQHEVDRLQQEIEHSKHTLLMSFEVKKNEEMNVLRQENTQMVLQLQALQQQLQCNMLESEKHRLQQEGDLRMEMERWKFMYQQTAAKKNEDVSEIIKKSLLQDMETLKKQITERDNTIAILKRTNFGKGNLGESMVTDHLRNQFPSMTVMDKSKEPDVCDTWVVDGETGRFWAVEVKYKLSGITKSDVDKVYKDYKNMQSLYPDQMLEIRRNRKSLQRSLRGRHQYPGLL
jgi:hypothetical protein